MTSLSIALLALAIWVYLAMGRGGFWRPGQDDRAMHTGLRGGAAPKVWPRVVAVIPARDEAALVGETVGSLLGHPYAGDLSVVVVDDHSVDGTADAARRAAVRAGAPERLTVLEAAPLPAGWTGKLWALSHGIAYADALPDPPRYLLLTDADIRYEADAVSALVSSAVENRLVLSSLMMRLRCESFAERTLIPAFVFFFQMLYPFAWIKQADRRTAAAAGGCVLLDRRALQAAGGIASIRGALIDDCALAARMKPQGSIQLALATHVESLRPYPRFDDIRRMVVRSAYAQLCFSAWRLVFVVLAMSLVFLAPVVLTVIGDGWTRSLALGAWALMAGLFVPMLRRYQVPAWWSLGLPLVAAIYLAFTIESAWLHSRGRGGAWKGRVQAGAADSR